MGFEAAAGFVKSTELDRDASADSDEGGESAFVEGQSSFFLVDGFGSYKSIGVLSCSLEADFDDVEGLALGRVSRGL